MVRDTHDVDISNKERALLCNDAGADVALRIHADGYESPNARGISVLYPSTGAHSAASKKMAAKLLEELIRTTEAKNRGIVPRNDLTGLNWSNVPSILLEMGFMTNPEEDKLLSTDDYQDKLATGMLNFVAQSLPLPH
jgi:N-acetylmuramoyl-L-alanine amidase